MRFVHTLSLVLAFGLATSCASAPSIPPNPPNILDAYVAAPDPTFAWKVEKTFTGAGFHGAVLELTSQTWMTAAESDRPVWKHWLTVTIPDKLSAQKAFLPASTAPPLPSASSSCNTEARAGSCVRHLECRRAFVHPQL